MRQAHLIHCSEGVSSDHGAQQTWYDPLSPDHARFPRAKDATPFVAVCGPGDTILVPGDWYHHAVSLTPSITLMRNFMNDANSDRFFEVWMANQNNPNKGPRPRPPLAPPQPPPALPPVKRSLPPSALGGTAATIAAPRGLPPPSAPPPAQSAGAPTALAAPAAPAAALAPRPLDSAVSPPASAGASAAASISVLASRAVYRQRPETGQQACLPLGTSGRGGSVPAASGPREDGGAARAREAWQWRDRRRWTAVGS